MRKKKREGIWERASALVAPHELHNRPDLDSIKGAHLFRSSQRSSRAGAQRFPQLPQTPAPSPCAALGPPDQCAQRRDSEWCLWD